MVGIGAGVLVFALYVGGGMILVYALPVILICAALVWVGVGDRKLIEWLPIADYIAEAGRVEGSVQSPSTVQARLVATRFHSSSSSLKSLRRSATGYMALLRANDGLILAALRFEFRKFVLDAVEAMA